MPSFRLPSILEPLPTPLAVCDLGGRIIYTTHALHELLGLSAPGARPSPRPNASTLSDLLYGAPDTAAAVRSAARHGRCPPFLARLGRAGDARWCRVRLSATTNGDDRVILATFEDITDEIRLTQRLRDRSKRYRLAVDQANDIIVNLDLNGRFTFVNPTASLLTKYLEEELLGMHFLALIRRDFRRHTGRFYADQIAQRVPSTYYEAPIVCRDGETLWIGQYVQLLRSDSGAISVQAIARNITNRRRAEDALRASEERLRAVIASAPIALWSCDLAGRVTLCEGQDLSGLGLPAGTTVGHVIDEPSMVAHLARARRGEAFHVERSAVGRRFDLWLSPAHNQQGAVNGVIGVAVDITERQHLRDRLHQMEKFEAIGRLAGGVAHNFNNQLTAILGYAELVARTLEPGDPRSDEVEEIIKAGTRAAAMTDQLLAYGRRLPRRPRVIDINAVIRDLEPLLRRSVRADIDIAIDLGPDAKPVRADPTQMENVVLNLVLNARDALEQGGTLTISTGMTRVPSSQASVPAMPSGRYVTIEVADTGCGMDEQTRARLFDPFFTTKEVGKGTGLGLASVYGIVKQSAGYIWVDSRIGRGTTFRIYLPPAVGPVEPPAAAVTVAEPRAGGGEAVLLVEDDASVRNLTTDLLLTEGYDVWAAANGSEALSIASAPDRVIDLLLTDLVMPDMTGYDLADTLRQSRPAMAVLFTTAHAHDSVAQRSVPGAGTLTKPFPPAALLRRVRVVLDTARTQLPPREPGAADASH